MKKGLLSDYISQIAYKKLSAVEANFNASHQHEFNGVSKLREILGVERREFTGSFIYLSDDDPDPVTAEAKLTWYDARANNPARAAEFRLYYYNNAVSQIANESDLLIIAKQPNNEDQLLVIIAESGSMIERQLLWMFGIGSSAHPGFSIKGDIESEHIKIEFTKNYILEKIGIPTEQADETYLDEMLHTFNGAFPSMHDFSAFARSKALGVDPKLDYADEVLMAYIDMEFILFKTLERHFLGETLQKTIMAPDYSGDLVDGFNSLALKVQNRRKNRAGNSFENHVEYIFKERNIHHTRGAKTENNAKPDFLFPGIKYYNDANFPITNLTVLGVKTSCKDRWRQILVEAAKIPTKHLLTLEPSRSKNQTDEMQAHNVQLILPNRHHASYSVTQQTWIMKFEEFLDLVETRQS